MDKGKEQYGNGNEAKEGSRDQVSIITWIFRERGVEREDGLTLFRTRLVSIYSAEPCPSSGTNHKVPFGHISASVVYTAERRQYIIKARQSSNDEKRDSRDRI